MSATLTRTRKPAQPLNPAVELVRPVCYPCTLLPAGQPGVVEVNGTVYLLQAVCTTRSGAVEVLGYRFLKGDGETRDVADTPHGLECDCPDALYRPRPGGCKHCCCVRILRERGQLI